MLVPRPVNGSGIRCRALHEKRVQRTRPDVAEDNTERAKNGGGAHGLVCCAVDRPNCSRSVLGVLSPTPLSLCHRTYGVGEDRGGIRLHDEPGARRQLAGAGPDAAGPDQDADPERSFVHGLREAKTVQRAWHVHVREHDPHIRAGWSATAIPTSCTRPKSYASPRTCRL